MFSGRKDKRKEDRINLLIYPLICLPPSFTIFAGPGGKGKGGEEDKRIEDSGSSTFSLSHSAAREGEKKKKEGEGRIPEPS